VEFVILPLGGNFFLYFWGWSSFQDLVLFPFEQIPAFGFPAQDVGVEQDVMRAWASAGEKRQVSSPLPKIPNRNTEKLPVIHKKLCLF
jgi:hypothetical protein